MRFGIATTVLVASQSTVFSVALDNDKVRRGGGSGVGFVSPSDFFNEQREFWSSSKKKTTETPNSNSNNVKRPQRIHQYQYQQRSRDIEARRELLKKRAERGLMVENRPLLNTYRENKNNDTKEQKKMECDPHALDTGILACGTGNYCKESQESSIGGICTHSIDEAAVLRNHVHDSRNLQQAFCSPEVSCPDGSFCNLASGEEGECEFCPCSTNPAYACYRIGLDNIAGFPECVSSCAAYTDMQPYPCQDLFNEYQYCTSSIAIGGDGETEYTTYVCNGVSPYCAYPGFTTCCYTFGYTLEYGPPGYMRASYTYNFITPYAQNVTFAFNNQDTNCALTFNEETCDVCYLTETYENTCFDFDCTNNPPGMSGNTCYDTNGFERLLPILDQCNTSPPYVGNGCSICGDDALDFPDVSLPYGYSCTDTYIYSYFGIENGTELCSYTQDYFSAVCCKGLPQCNICGAGELLNPDASVYVPETQSMYACNDLYVAGGLGLIDSGTCPAVTAAAGSICCEAPEPCLVCTDDEDVTNPDNIITTPGNPAISCAQLQELGRQGLIPSKTCVSTSVVVSALCGCGPEGPSDMPGSAPSDMPGSEPSDMPGSEPSDTPGNAPSDVPAGSELPATEPPTPPPAPTPTLPPAPSPVSPPAPEPTPAPVDQPVPEPTPLPVVSPTPAPVAPPTSPPSLQPTPAPTPMGYGFLQLQIEQSGDWCLSATERRTNGNLRLRPCDFDGKPDYQLWTFDESNRLHSMEGDDRCMRTGNGSEPFDGIRMRLGVCDDPLNQFSWDPMTSRLSLISDEYDYCITNLGGTANYGDTIHGKPCPSRNYDDYEWAFVPVNLN